MGVTTDDANKTTDKDEAIVRLAGSNNELADVELISGKNKIHTISQVTVNTTLGVDPIPDVFFTIDTAGAIGDTIRVQIAGTSIDGTSPDRDLPSVDVTTTITASEVGDEVALRGLVISDLNADSDFQNAFLKAQAPNGDQRAIVHITSTEFSLPGEFHERPNAGDVAVTVTGTTTITLDSSVLISREKPSSLARDIENPHRIGVLGIAGSVFVTPGGLPNRFVERLVDSGASSLMMVDGSTTPVQFCVTADSGGDFDIFISSISFHGQDNGVKFGQFLGQNSPLTNGISPTIISEGVTINLFNIYETGDLKHEFTLGEVQNWSNEKQAGRDDVVATATFDPPFPLIAGSSDKVCMLIQDNLTSVLHIETIVTGFKREA